MSAFERKSKLPRVFPTTNGDVHFAPPTESESRSFEDIYTQSGALLLPRGGLASIAGSQFLNPIEMGTLLEPGLVVTAKRMWQLTRNVKGPSLNDKELRDIAFEFAPVSMSTAETKLQQAGEAAERLARHDFASSPQGEQYSQLDIIIPKLEKLGDGHEDRIRNARNAKESQEPFWLKAGGTWKSFSGVAAAIGIALVLACAVTATHMVASERGNAAFLMDNSGYFDEYPREVANEKIEQFVFVLVVSLFVALKAPLFIPRGVEHEHKRKLAVAMRVLAVASAVLFGAKMGGAMDSSRSGPGVPGLPEQAANSWSDSIPFALFAVCTLTLAATAVSILSDAMIWAWRRLLPTEVRHNDLYHCMKEHAAQLEAVYLEEVNTLSHLKGRREKLIAARERHVEATRRRVGAFWAELDLELREALRKFKAVILLGCLATASGCSQPTAGSQPAVAPPGNAGAPDSVSSAESPNTEWFLFVAPGMPRPTLEALWQTLVAFILKNSQAGDRICVLSGADHQHIATIVVPEGTQGRRGRDPQLRAGLARLAPLFLPKSEPSDAEMQINLPLIASSVAATRHTAAACKVIICGDPIHVDRQSGWTSKGGWTPNQASLFDPLSPYGIPTSFPDGTEVVWITPSMNWGEGPNHQKESQNFIRFLFQTRGATLVRMAPDPTTAFVMEHRQFPTDVPVRRDVSGMWYSHVVGERPSDAKEDGKRDVPHNARLHEPPPELPSEQLQGLSPPELKKIMEEGMVNDPTSLIVVRDDSGSMSHAAVINRNMTTTLARTLPLISPSFEVGVLAYAGKEPAVLPFTTIRRIKEDNGQSLSVLVKFLDEGKTKGGYADMRLALDLAISQFSRSDRRQVLMVIGDTAEESTEGVATDFEDRKKAITGRIKGWLDEAPQLRSVVLIYVPGEGKSDTPTSRYLRELSTTLQRCYFSDQPTSMLDLVLKAIHAR